MAAVEHEGGTHDERQRIPGIRDSFEDGKGKTALPPGSIRVGEFLDMPTLGEGMYVARIDVDQPAFDRRTMFTLSASQARLIGDSTRDAKVSYAKEFGQKNGANDARYLPYAFNDAIYYASSPSGAQNATFYLAFPKPPLEGQKPRFLQVKGLRLPLPEAQPEPTISTMAALLDRRSGAVTGLAAEDLRRLFSETENAPVRRLDIGRATIFRTLDVLEDVGAIERIDLPGSLEVDDKRYLVSGAGDFNRTGLVTGSRELRIMGIYEPPGTRVVRLNVSRTLSPVDIYNVDRIRALRKAVGDEAGVELVDRSFDTYQPFGYIWERTGEGRVVVYLDQPAGGRWTLGSLPQAGEEDRLYLLYRLPASARISGVVFRDPAKPIDKARVAAVADWTVPSER